MLGLFEEENMDPKQFLSEQSKQVLEDEALREQLKKAKQGKAAKTLK